MMKVDKEPKKCAQAIESARAWMTLLCGDIVGFEVELVPVGMQPRVEAMIASVRA